jgi:hypothetical protein
MRIYFTQDTNKLVKAVEKYFINTKYETFAYSTEGIFTIDHANIYKLNIQDNKATNYENYYNNISVTMDKTIITKEVVNQLPPEHVIILKKINTYKIDNKSNIKLIIEFNSSIDKIIDYYFEVPDSTQVHDVLFKKSLIESTFSIFLKG